MFFVFVLILVETDETIFILATSYYRSNLIHQAYWLLKEKSRRSPQCRFLLAKCAFQLKKYSEAECALTSISLGELKNFDEITKEFGEVACFALQLIAQICVKTERDKTAAEALRKALKLNPFMWHAFSDLCHLGEQADASSIFQVNSTDVFNTCQGNLNTNSMILFGTNGLNVMNTLNDNLNCMVGNNTIAATNIGVTSGSDTITNNNSSNYILSTPVEVQQQQQQQIQSQLQSQNTNSVNMLQNLTTPINNNLNSSISILRGGGNNTGLSSGVGNQNQNTNMMMLDDTPIGCLSANDQLWLTTSGGTFDGGAGTPFRKPFKYLSTVSPSTPSFGILPLNSPCSGDASLIGAGHTHPILNITNTPSPQTLVEVNQEQKVVCKKLKGHVGNLMNRKDSAGNSVTNKPAVFTQTGNNTPRTPNNASSVGTGK